MPSDPLSRADAPSPLARFAGERRPTIDLSAIHRRGGIACATVGTHKLTEADVLTIRSLRGRKTQEQLAKMFRVSLVAIERVIYRKTWTHLAEGE